MKALGFRVIISSPYSFAAAPVEYAFAFFKAVNNNPKSIRTSKKYFRNLVKLVLKRLKKITPSFILSLWKHVVPYLFEYLVLKRL